MAGGFPPWLMALMQGGQMPPGAPMPQQSKLQGIMTNPLFMGGLGILGANAKSRNPTNPMAGLMSGLQNAGQYENQLRDQQLQQMFYGAQLGRMAKQDKKDEAKAKKQAYLDAQVEGLIKNLPPEMAAPAMVAAIRANPSAFTSEMARATFKSSSDEAPMDVRTYQFWKSLPEKEQEEFLRVKRATQWIDTGGSIVAPSLSLPGGEPQTSFDKTLTPDQAADMDIKAGEAGQHRNLAVLPMKQLKTQLTELRDHQGLDNVTGWLYGRTPTISQEGRNAQELLDSIKSQISVYKLQSMRDASTSGGAVGNVTEKEWPRLESAIAALGQSQDTATYKKRLNEVLKAIDESVNAIDNSYNMVWGANKKQGGGWSIEPVQ